MSLPVNDDRIRGRLIAIATTFLLAAAAEWVVERKREKSQKMKPNWLLFVWPISIHSPRQRFSAVGQNPETHKGGMRGEGKNRQKKKRGRKGTTTHPTNSERPFKSEKPARQSVTLILKSNSTPMQLHCTHTHTLSHSILPFVSGSVRGACWPAPSSPPTHLPVPFTA